MLCSGSACSGTGGGRGWAGAGGGAEREVVVAAGGGGAVVGDGRRDDDVSLPRPSSASPALSQASQPETEVLTSTQHFQTPVP
jgi:hypothetical protein